MDGQEAPLPPCQEDAVASAERTVEVIEEDPRSERRILRLRDLPDDACVLVLGDPGSGKTTCMAEAASFFGGSYIPVREFLARPASLAAPGTSLFLDALDEALAGGPSNPADAVARKLHECGQPRFWLSCRPVDWSALAGARVLRDAAGKRSLMAVRLRPLDDASVEALVRARGQEPAAFLRQVDEARLNPLLRNPQTLLLMLDVASKGGGLPSSRRALYETAADLLAREANRERPRLHHTHRPPPSAAVLDAAGLACSALLLADRDAVAFESPADDRDVSLGDLDPEGTDGDALRAALASRLFSAVGADRFVPQHRTVAEFLAARFLVRRVAERGLPLRRVEALLRGRHPEPHPSLRGLFAWVTTLLPARAESLVRLDPYGVLAYGDPGELGPAALRALLAALAELERRDPFFRSGLWGEARLAPLASPALAGALQEVLESRPWPGQLASCVLEALSEGQPLPELVATLANIVLDASVPEDGRVDAILALLRACAGDASVAVGVFRQLLRSGDPGGARALAARLLVQLYPDHLDLADLANFAEFFAGGSERTTRHAHIEWHLPDLVPPGAEAAVLDIWAAQPWVTGPRPTFGPTYDLARVARALLPRALPTLDADEAARLVAWLTIINAHERDNDKAMAAAFAARADLFAPMAIAATKLGDRDTPKMAYAASYNLRQLAPWWIWPEDGGWRLLERGLSEADPFRRELLFRFCLKFCFDRVEAYELFERVCEEAKRHPDLAELVASGRICAVPDEKHYWQRHQALRQRKQQNKDGLQRAENLRRLRDKLPQIADGTAQNALLWCADVCLGYLIGAGEQDKQAAPFERLSREADTEVAAAARAGLRLLASNGWLPSPAEFAGLRVRGGDYKLAHAWVLGADLLFEDSSEGMPQLSHERLVSLMVLALVAPTSVGNRQKREWPGCVTRTLPADTAAAMRDFLLPQIEAGLQFVAGLHEALRDPAFGAVKRLLLPDLIERVSCGSAVDLVLDAALADLPADALLAALRRRLDAVGDRHDARWPMLVAAWMLAPEEFEERIGQALDSDQNRLADLAERTGELTRGFASGARRPLRLAHRIFLVHRCGPSWPPAPRPVGIFSSPCAADLANFVARQFDAIAADPLPEAGAALEAFAADASLAPHSPMLRHALARRRRDDIRRGWETPSPEALAGALRAGAPASADDLLAFAEDHLRSLDAELRTTQENRWKGFWDSRPLRPKIENDCRDHLCGLLAGRFDAAGLAASVEARVSGDDRCDIKVRSLSVTLPVEVKGEWHPKLWTAWRDQLGEGYAREPSSAGRGVYLVFWCGRRNLTHPDSGDGIGSALQLEHALQSMVDSSDHTLRVVVMDVTPPGVPSGSRPKKPSAKKLPVNQPPQ
ncbi:MULTISPECIES: NACHT domain-containing protein [Roseomonadaceae]|uniref:ATP-binding protein n=1 Tax=Falsiroseomonas oleicola TaxID=2801474 RepID=A0ABS6H212_9PROT|nr:hypothetical protein [Roseomonas oleicola]MBU8542705.1 hypothetical protein [Roseomonas oleicola]